MKAESLHTPASQSPLSYAFEGLRIAPQRRWRVALYSHDTMGLGHTRRNLLIAQTLAHSGLALDMLLIRGMGEGLGVSLPPGVDCLTLPAFRKQSDGSYSARHLSLDLVDLVQLRAQTLQAALSAFAPDALIVDNVPRGAQHELDPALAYLRRRGRTRCILGLRDILDSPEIVQREWQQSSHEATINSYYDAVWIYGDPQVYDSIHAYNFTPQTIARSSYLGYLDQRLRLEYSQQPLPLQLSDARLALCLLGGGQDGMQLAEAFVQAHIPENMQAVLLTGPFMPAEQRVKLEGLLRDQNRLHILSTADEPTQLIQRADKIISMAGYNSVAELLSFEKHALLVPRVQPRQEQLIRAERLSGLGLADMLHPEQLTPQALSSWLAQAPKKPDVHSTIDMQGLSRIPQMLADLLGSGIRGQGSGLQRSFHSVGTGARRYYPSIHSSRIPIAMD